MNSRSKPCKSQTKGSYLATQEPRAKSGNLPSRRFFQASQMNPIGCWKTWEAISGTSAFSRFFPIGKRSIQLDSSRYEWRVQQSFGCLACPLRGYSKDVGLRLNRVE